MLSRIADSLFWMARYMERTDGILRMLKINCITALDRSGEPDFNWLPVLKILAVANMVVSIKYLQNHIYFSG